MIIAVDFDNILNNLAEKTVEFYNAHNDKNIQMSDITSYNFYDCFSKEDADGMVKLFKTKALWDLLTPIPGARDGLQKLVDAGHRVYIVTATATENWPWKISWFKKYFPFFNTDNIIRMMDKSLFKCDVMIEDCYDQLIKNRPCRKICLDYPWNRNEGRDFVYDIRRCENWTQILEAVNQIEKEIKEYERECSIS